MLSGRCTHHWRRALRHHQEQALQLHRQRRHRPVPERHLRCDPEEAVQSDRQNNDGGDGSREQPVVRRPLLRYPEAEGGAVPIRLRPPDRRQIEQDRGQAARLRRFLRCVREVDNEDGQHRGSHGDRRADQEQLSRREPMIEPWASADAVV